MSFKRKARRARSKRTGRGNKRFTRISRLEMQVRRAVVAKDVKEEDDASESSVGD